MKKIKILLVITVLILISCTRPVLERNEYKIIDTLKIHYNNAFHMSIDGADVIIKYDSTYHYGYLNNSGNLIEMNPRNLKLPIKK